MLIGPFFYVPQKRKIIYNACALENGECRYGGKYDNPYGHEQLWDDHFSNGDYINYPRGRVIYDGDNQQALIYIDRCIDKPAMIEKIKELFDINIPYVVEYDFHYQCKRCLKNILDE